MGESIIINIIIIAYSHTETHEFEGVAVFASQHTHERVLSIHWEEEEEDFSREKPKKLTLL